jgi:hypothetical protein
VWAPIVASLHIKAQPEGLETETASGTAEVVCFAGVRISTSKYPAASWTVDDRTAEGPDQHGLEGFSRICGLLVGRGSEGLAASVVAKLRTLWISKLKSCRYPEL